MGFRYGSYGNVGKRFHEKMKLYRRDRHGEMASYTEYKVEKRRDLRYRYGNYGSQMKIQDRVHTDGN